MGTGEVECRNCPFYIPLGAEGGYGECKKLPSVNGFWSPQKNLELLWNQCPDRQRSILIEQWLAVNHHLPAEGRDDPVFAVCLRVLESLQNSLYKPVEAGFDFCK